MIISSNEPVGADPSAIDELATTLESIVRLSGVVMPEELSGLETRFKCTTRIRDPWYSNVETYNVEVEIVDARHPDELRGLAVWLLMAAAKIEERYAPGRLDGADL